MQGEAAAGVCFARPGLHHHCARRCHHSHHAHSRQPVLADSWHRLARPPVGQPASQVCPLACPPTPHAPPRVPNPGLPIAAVQSPRIQNHHMQVTVWGHPTIVAMAAAFVTCMPAARHDCLSACACRNMLINFSETYNRSGKVRASLPVCLSMVSSSQQR